MRQIQLITTTTNVEGWRIEKYFGIVTNQVVIGTDLFKDIFASWRDVFGGNVKSYQKELEKLENIALNELKRKASQKGANVIIGLRLDFDEISGGGKSMFMLTATGTAVLAKNQNSKVVEQYENSVSLEQLNYEKNRRKILEGLENGQFSISSIRKIDDLINYKIEALKPVLSYLNGIDNIKEDFENNKNIYFEYFSNISHEAISSYLQSEEFLLLKSSTFQVFLKILDSISWFDVKVISGLLDGSNIESQQRAIYLLLLKKSNYTIDDANSLKMIAERIKILYSSYPKIVEIKGVFGKDKQKWECPTCQKQNPMENDICLKEGCETNKFGFRRPFINPLERMSTLELEAQIIENLLGSS